MKMESQKRQENIFFLATENVIIHVNQPYVIRQDMIETKNFIPEAFLIHQIHQSDMAHPALTGMTSAGDLSAPQAFFLPVSDPFASSGDSQEFSYLSDDEDEDDWDDEDEDWDDEDEDWDDEDEDWDDEDEDWDDEDEEFGEDEDWSDDEE